MLTMIGRRLLLGAGVLLAMGSAQATPIDDCNQSKDGELQIAGCTRLLRMDPFGPNAALAYGLRGEAYKDKGDLDRAIADYNEAIRQKPNFAEAFDRRGAAYQAMGDDARASADFAAAARLAASGQPATS